MEPHHAASQTALGTAYLRAAHQLLETSRSCSTIRLPRRCWGPGESVRIRANAEAYRSPAAQLQRAHVVLRSRFAEVRLADAVAREITQYVLPGAGLDTFSEAPQIAMRQDFAAPPATGFRASGKNRQSAFVTASPHCSNQGWSYLRFSLSRR